MIQEWTPFDKDGNLNITYITDPWWKRLRAWYRHEPVWYHVGKVRDGGR